MKKNLGLMFHKENPCETYEIINEYEVVFQTRHESNWRKRSNIRMNLTVKDDESSHYQNQIEVQYVC